MSKRRTKKIEYFADIFGALANPKRLQIYMRLIDCCDPGTSCRIQNGIPTCVGDLLTDLDVAPSTLSHHLKELRRVGLIRMERRGQNVECRVDPDTRDKLTQFMEFALV